MPTAKKAKATKKPVRKASAPKQARRKSVEELQLLLTNSAMLLAASKGWGEVTLAGMAKGAGVSEAEAREVFTEPVDVLRHLIALADEANFVVEGAGNIRDNLFELTMQRFDVLMPYRAGIAAVEAAKREWPSLACKLLPSLMESSRLMLELAGVPQSGPVSRLRQVVWLSVKADIARTWFDDDSADLSKTMAVLDQRLGQLEKFAEVTAPWAGR